MNSEMTGGDIFMVDSSIDDLKSFVEMEKSADTENFILPYSLARHLEEFHKPNTVYKSIRDASHNLIGFVLLIIEPEGPNVEFRRIVIAKKNRGFGKKAVELVDRICRDEIKAKRIWLDVFDFNSKAQKIYENAGYKYKRNVLVKDKVLKIYEKTWRIK